MSTFKMPHDFKVNTRGGDLEIPAGSTVHVHEDDRYSHHETPDESQEAEEQEFAERLKVAQEPEPEPAKVEEAPKAEAPKAKPSFAERMKAARAAKRK